MNLMRKKKHTNYISKIKVNHLILFVNLFGTMHVKEDKKFMSEDAGKVFEFISIVL